MKIEITNAQLQAILDIATDAEAELGASEPAHGQNDADPIMKKRLRLVKSMFIKNGYENPFSTI